MLVWVSREPVVSAAELADPDVTDVEESELLSEAAEFGKMEAESEEIAVLAEAAEVARCSGVELGNSEIGTLGTPETVLISSEVVSERSV
ncbi:MAG: hypothetical protein K2J73_00395, partial [Oscillospiraceae bacterium]|nr:hypothetical protein [Oscillospiraceae bacterium]